MNIREDEEQIGNPAEDFDPISLVLEDPEKLTYIGASLQEALRGMKNIDIFAWTVADMPGIDLDLITHKLNIDPNQKTVKKKRRRNFAPERQEIIKQEMDKLLEAGFI